MSHNNNNNEKPMVRADMQHVKDIPESMKSVNPFPNSTTTSASVPIEARNQSPQLGKGCCTNDNNNNNNNQIGRKLDNCDSKKC